MATELVQSLTIIIIRITSCLEFLLCVRILLRLSGVFHLIFMVIHEVVYLTYFESICPKPLYFENHLSLCHTKEWAFGSEVSIL